MSDYIDQVRWDLGGSDRDEFQRFLNNFINVRHVIERRAPQAREIRLHQCADIDNERKKSRRAFMHVGHKPDLICSTLATLPLDDNYQCGLFFHEFGHVLTPGGTEQDADRVIFEMYGITILYKDMDLEWVDAKKIFPNRY